jgi:hypothetical protein
MKRYKTILQEAFASSQIQKAIIKTCSILSRRIGKKISVSLIPMDVLKADGARLSGIVGIFGDRRIRFNWRSMDRSSQIVSVDYWTKVRRFPDYTLETGDYNIIQLLSALTEFIKNPTEGQILTEDVVPTSTKANFHPDVKASINAFFTDMGLGENDLANRRITELYSQYLFWYREGQGAELEYKEVSSATFRSFVIAYLAKYSLTNIFMREVKVKKGTKEKIVLADKMEAKKFDKEIFNMTLNDKVEMVKHSTRMVIQGFQNCLILGGTAGVGKTTLVQQATQEAKGKNVVNIKGSISSPEEYYKLLYRTNSKDTIVIIDDVDELLQTKYLGIQKAALDSAKKRIVTMFSKNINDDDVKSKVKQDDVLARAMGDYQGKDKKIKYPTSFELESRFIIITNMPKKKVNPALLSRGLYLEMNFTPADIIDSLRVNVDQLFPEFSDILDSKAKLDVIDFLEEYMGSVKYIDYRIFKAIASCRAADPYTPLWKKFAMMAVTSL